MMTVLACGMVWKLYADSPGEPKLYLCTGATLLIAAAALLIIGRMKKAEEAEREYSDPYPEPPDFGSQPRAKDSGAAFLEGLGLGQTQRQASEAEAAAGAADGDRSAAWKNGGFAGSAQPSEPRSTSGGGSRAGAGPLLDTYFGPAPTAGSPVSSSPLSQPPVQGGADDLAGRTMLLRPADATVFLGGKQTATEAEAAVPCLEWDRAGSCERIRLTKAAFVIGRAGGEADWVHDEIGVSRLHAELVRGADGSVSIKDLGSRNGTTVNGEALVPYKLHTLKEGDRIRIVSTEYTFMTA